MTVNIYEAKTHLSKLIDEAETGEEVVIARAGTPVVKLVPVNPPRPKRRVGGLARGEFVVPDDFNDPLPEEVIADFYK